jgi:sugar-specific transcriptional regulator TrmB
MTPIDYRNTTFAQIKTQLTEQRLAVYTAMLRFGSGTTRELAQKSGIDLLTLRPRVTELVQLGFATLVETEKPGKEGIYRALVEVEAMNHFKAQQTKANRELQPELL